MFHSSCSTPALPSPDFELRDDLAVVRERAAGVLEPVLVVHEVLDVALEESVLQEDVGGDDQRLLLVRVVLERGDEVVVRRVAGAARGRDQEPRAAEVEGLLADALRVVEDDVREREL